MPEITVTINGVTKLLEKLNPYKASGPGMVSARFLKEVATEISPALTSKALYQRNVKSQCYKTYVRPIVEYASVPWDPVGE